MLNANEFRFIRLFKFKDEPGQWVSAMNAVIGSQEIASCSNIQDAHSHTIKIRSLATNP